MLKRLSHVESQRQENLDKKQREEEETRRAHADKRSVIIRINKIATLFKCSKTFSFQNKSAKMFPSRSAKLRMERSARLDTDEVKHQI